MNKKYYDEISKIKASDELKRKTVEKMNVARENSSVTEFSNYKKAKYSKFKQIAAGVTIMLVTGATVYAGVSKNIFSKEGLKNIGFIKAGENYNEISKEIDEIIETKYGTISFSTAADNNILIIEYDIKLNENGKNKLEKLIDEQKKSKLMNEDNEEFDKNSPSDKDFLDLECDLYFNDKACCFTKNDIIKISEDEYLGYMVVQLDNNKTKNSVSILSRSFLYGSTINKKISFDIEIDKGSTKVIAEKELDNDNTIKIKNFQNTKIAKYITLSLETKNQTLKSSTEEENTLNFIILNDKDQIVNYQIIKEEEFIRDKKGKEYDLREIDENDNIKGTDCKEYTLLVAENVNENIKIVPFKAKSLEDNNDEKNIENQDWRSVKDDEKLLAEGKSIEKENSRGGKVKISKIEELQDKKMVKFEIEKKGKIFDNCLIYRNKKTKEFLKLIGERVVFEKGINADKDEEIIDISNENMEIEDLEYVILPEFHDFIEYDEFKVNIPKETKKVAKISNVKAEDVLSEYKEGENGDDDDDEIENVSIGGKEYEFDRDLNYEELKNIIEEMKKIKNDNRIKYDDGFKTKDGKIILYYTIKDENEDEDFSDLHKMLIEKTEDSYEIILEDAE